ncbi:MAG: precorrin-3B C(17)-methyltransferase [Gemmataceae bacterium]|nr:precorrin-3B C(17)-methyltransferase [Gemmataceae bacterium]
MGRFWAVGVGPGDPDLLTVKAVEVIRRAHVLYHAGPRSDEGRAWQIIRHLVHPEKQVRLLLHEPMRVASARGDRSAYRSATEQIAIDCRAGLDVALVTEGDPTLYSTASYVWELLRELYPDVPVDVIPGITSIAAAAARVGWPLAQRGETVAILPTGYRRDELRPILEQFSTVCLLKVAQALPDLTEALAQLPDGGAAVYAENVATADEWISHDLTTAAGRDAYFALILVRHGASPPATPEPTGSPCVAPGAGKLWVVGLGPGDPTLLTPQAREALRSVEVVVGYDAYLDALRPLALPGEFRGSPIGAEAERARLALDLATAGRRVALVSSGDAGVYGMASLVLETAEAIPEVAVEIVPGVTAALAAAALLGAPLGHDFACVSLSDLLTPWTVITRRLDAAGQGDFVVALYNPVSRKRTWQLPQARDILLRHRGPGTPVGVIDRAFRAGQRVRLTTLGELSGEGLGMETVVIVGSSTTRIIRGRMVTPRGYGERA